VTFELGTDGPTLILVAVDGSDTSLRAASYAAGLARRQGVRLVAVFVHSYAGLAPLAPAAGVALREANAQLAKDLIAQATGRAKELGIEITVFEREGDPFDEVVRLAIELRADAVVVGASESPAHRIAGSLGVRLVKAKLWPVTVVP
jgi:nucleotide-binding universal stress UspA family protein